MPYRTNTTITVTGLDDAITDRIAKLILNALEEDQLQAYVRVERAARPHHLWASLREAEGSYAEQKIGRFTSQCDATNIQLVGVYTVDELDGMSYKLRGGV